MTCASLSKTTKTTSHVTCLALTSVLGSRGIAIQSEMEKYLHSNGVEWTVARYKAINTAAYHLKNNDRAKAIQVYRESGIAYHKDTLYPKGQIGYVVKQFVSATREKTIRKYAGLMRLYTAYFVDGHPTEKQSVKAVKSITTRYSGLKENSVNEMWFAERIIQMRITTNKFSSETFSKVIKTAPRPLLHSNSYYFSGLELTAQDWKTLKAKPYGSMVLSLMTESWVPESLRTNFRKESVRHIQDEYGCDSGYAGRVLGMQQNACKLRVVAQPSAAIQDAFAPMHSYLMKAVDMLYSKESCVKDQMKGAYAIKRHLDEGRDVYSVDLSSATDRFPRFMSQAVLCSLGLKEYSDALEEVCNRPWLNANLIGSKDLYYETGQPMGLYGSFPLFHLSNLVVADMALQRAQSRSDSLIPFADGTFFKVVGDDIVLSDPLVAEQYKEEMLALGVEISPTKTFSGKVAEFAGFMAVPKNNGKSALYRPYKFTRDDWNCIQNPLEFVHAFGSSVEKLGDRWKDVFKSYTATINYRYPDLTPVLRSDKDIPYRIVGKEPWLNSVILLSQEAITRAPSDADEHRQALCVQDWLSENSGYCFAGVGFGDYVAEVATSCYKISRINDVAFTPERQLESDIDSKTQYRALRNLDKDPLIADYKYNQNDDAAKMSEDADDASTANEAKTSHADYLVYDSVDTPERTVSTRSFLAKEEEFFARSDVKPYEELLRNNRQMSLFTDLGQKIKFAQLRCELEQIRRSERDHDSMLNRGSTFRDDLSL